MEHPLHAYTKEEGTKEPKVPPRNHFEIVSFAGIDSSHAVRQDMAMDREKDFYRRMAERGTARRGFVKFRGLLTVTMGLSSSFFLRLAEFFAALRQRPPVIGFHFSECAGGPGDIRAR